MSYKSERQKAWANSPEGIKALGQEKVSQLNQSSEGKSLPVRSAPKVNKGRKPETPEKKMNFKTRSIRWV